MLQRFEKMFIEKVYNQGHRYAYKTDDYAVLCKKKPVLYGYKLIASSNYMTLFNGLFFNLDIPKHKVLDLKTIATKKLWDNPKFKFTKVLVKNIEDTEWRKRYFYKYEEKSDRIYVLAKGLTPDTLFNIKVKNCIDPTSIALDSLDVRVENKLFEPFDQINLYLDYLDLNKKTADNLNIESKVLFDMPIFVMEDEDYKRAHLCDIKKINEDRYDIQVWANGCDSFTSDGNIESVKKIRYIPETVEKLKQFYDTYGEEQIKDTYYINHIENLKTMSLNNLMNTLDYY